MLPSNLKKLNIVCGHYGSGKTNLAVNLALEMRRRDANVKIYAADLDIVNPYFRTADAADILRKHEIEPLIPEFANTNVDIPSLPPKLMSLMNGSMDNEISILDVGGDEGAVVLGMYNMYIQRTGYDMYYVINQYRPLIAAVEDAYLCMKEIEAVSGLKCTKLINNSSLGAETTAEDVVASVVYAKECAERCGIPLICHAYCPEYAPDVPESFQKHGFEDETLFAIENVTRRLF